jgi:hypothetical protein
MVALLALGICLSLRRRKRTKRNVAAHSAMSEDPPAPMQESKAYVKAELPGKNDIDKSEGQQHYGAASRELPIEQDGPFELGISTPR